MSLSIRIISGKYGSRILRAPKELPIRPTKSQVKESLFNILQNKLSFRNLKVVDLFCGMGSISYEFASRGANVIAVDEHPGCIKFVEKSTEELNASITPIKSDVFNYIEKNQPQADLFFADPPYNFDREDYDKLINSLFSVNQNDDVWLIIEHSSKIDVHKHNYCTDSRKYGSSRISFFQQ